MECPNFSDIRYGDMSAPPHTGYSMASPLERTRRQSRRSARQRGDAPPVAAAVAPALQPVPTVTTAAATAATTAAAAAATTTLAVPPVPAPSIDVERVAKPLKNKVMDTTHGLVMGQLRSSFGPASTCGSSPARSWRCRRWRRWCTECFLF